MGDFVLFDDVCKHYLMGEHKIPAADHVSFTVAEGEFCVIVGPSGAGKTTVLNMLGGMDSCDSGTIMLDGREISALNERQLTDYRRHDVGFVFQFYNLVQNLTALENVELASEICKNPTDAKEALAMVGLSDRMFNFPPNCPAVSSNAWLSRVHWLRTRNCSFAMNPPVSRLQHGKEHFEAAAR